MSDIPKYVISAEQRTILSKIMLKTEAVKAFFHNVFISHYLVNLNYIFFNIVHLIINSMWLIPNLDCFFMYIYICKAIRILRLDRSIRNKQRANKIFSVIQQQQGKLYRTVSICLTLLLLTAINIF